VASQQFSNVLIIPVQTPTIGGYGNTQPVQYVIQAPSLNGLIDVMPKLMTAVVK
jgi:multidrug efflux pump